MKRVPRSLALAGVVVVAVAAGSAIAINP